MGVPPRGVKLLVSPALRTVQSCKVRLQLKLHQPNPITIAVDREINARSLTGCRTLAGRTGKALESWEGVGWLPWPTNPSCSFKSMLLQMSSHSISIPTTRTPPLQSSAPQLLPASILWSCLGLGTSWHVQEVQSGHSTSTDEPGERLCPSLLLVL